MEAPKKFTTYTCIRCGHVTPHKHNHIAHLKTRTICEGSEPLWDEYIKYGIYQNYTEIMETQLLRIKELEEKVQKKPKYTTAVITQEQLDLLVKKNENMSKNMTWKTLLFYSHVIHDMYAETKCIEYQKSVNKEYISIIGNKKQKFPLKEGVVQIFKDTHEFLQNMSHVECYTDHVSDVLDDFQSLTEEEEENMIAAFKNINLKTLF